MTLHKDNMGRGIHQPGQFKVTNNTGIVIPKGTAVQIVGYNLFTLVEPVNNQVSNDILGVAVDDILANANGYVARMGMFNQFDTSAWANGTTLYSDPNGNLVTTALGPIIGTVRKVSPIDGIIQFDVRSTTIPPGSDGYNTVVTSVLQADINNGFINLPAVPAFPALTVVSVRGAPGQTYQYDFTVSGNQLNFVSTNPGDLGNVLSPGDKLTIMYK